MKLFKFLIVLCSGILLVFTANLSSERVIAATPIATAALNEGMWNTFSQADALVVGKDHILTPIKKLDDTKVGMDKTKTLILASSGKAYQILTADKIAGSPFAYMVDEEVPSVLSSTVNNAANVLQVDLRTGQSKVLYSQKNISEIFVSPNEKQIVVTYIVTDANGKTRGARAFCVLTVVTGTCKVDPTAGHFYLSMGWIDNNTFFYTNRGSTLPIVDTRTMQERNQIVKGMAGIDYGAYNSNKGVFTISGLPTPLAAGSPDQVFEYDPKTNSTILVASADIIDKCLSIDGMRVSSDGKYLSFFSGGCASHGQLPWSIVEAKTNKVLVTGIKGVDYTTMQWKRDLSGLLVRIGNQLNFVDINAKTINPVSDAPEDAVVIIP